jgi:hypothetical protein
VRLIVVGHEKVGKTTTLFKAFNDKKTIQDLEKEEEKCINFSKIWIK